MFKRIEPHWSLASSRALEPAAGVQERIWARIAARITPAYSVESLWDKVRDALTPPTNLREYMGQRLLANLAMEPAPQPSPYVWVKWVASLAVVALVVQASPALFLATPTVAESQVVLVPTRGAVALSLGELWQSVSDDLTVEPGMRIRTYDGESSIIFRDDAVIRLNSDTGVAVHDTVEHTESADAFIPSFSLEDGGVWMQGLLPTAIRGMTLAVPGGSVTVHEGSVSVEVADDKAVTVKVWDRSADVLRGAERISLSVGEQVTLRGEGPVAIKQIPEAEFTEDWAAQNLAKDAVHRRSISHLQQERRASAAGILPTSSLYSVKRVAEAVDLFFSLDDESRVQKQLSQANTRLNEAAALLSEGEEAGEALQDFRDTLLALAETGTGDDLASQLLIRESMATTIAEVAAALPGDESYVLKKTVLEVATDLPSGGVIDKDGVEAVLFADSLTSFSEVVGTGDSSQIAQTWVQLQPYLALLDDESQLDTRARKEARLMLARLALDVEQQTGTGVASIDPEVLQDISSFLPPRPAQTVAALTEEDINMIVVSILERVYTYKMPRSRENQLRLEIGAIQGDDYGRILRALYRALPEDSRLREITRREVVELRWDQAAQQLTVQHEVAPAQSGSTIETEL
jgi:hypothetical protein